MTRGRRPSPDAPEEAIDIMTTHSPSAATGSGLAAAAAASAHAATSAPRAPGMTVDPAAGPSPEQIRQANLEIAARSIELEQTMSADGSLAGDPEFDPMAPPTPEEIARIRAARTPMGAFRQKLALPTRPGYHRHWFNDLPGRVDQAKLSGWTHVLDHERRPLKRSVGRSGEHGGGQMAYAMELPEVLWLEDMQAQHAEAASRMNAVKAQPFAAPAGVAQPADNQKFYNPVEGQRGVVDISGPGR